ncbi:hypothetical protein QN277_005106 [Acacia crassicarpa]|uniref:Uncharacterized protein n=1 Tax=Acacia crassicarpa TaxID=499986 RepID=A0AAE1MDS7_9FABA|nr:hypothetical protein QN277_005106 [Acacia crassicarpa]
MTESPSSSSSSKRETRVADLDFQLKRVSVQRWILGGKKEPHLLKQHGSLADFNQEFDRVTDNLEFTEDELVRVYIAGLKDEIAASLCLFGRPTTLLEARSLARDQEIISQMQSPKEVTNDGSSLLWTQEVQEKALEDQDACGSSQEESFDKQATLTSHLAIEDDIGIGRSMGHFLLCIYTVVGIAVGFAIATTLPIYSVLPVALLSVLGNAFLYALARAILYIRDVVAAKGQRAAEVAVEGQRAAEVAEEGPLAVEVAMEGPLSREVAAEEQPLTPIVNRLREGEEEA